MNAHLLVSDLSIAPAKPRVESFIVNRLSVNVAAGQSVGLVGESGSGKSMTLRAIAGLLPESVRVTGGKISVGDMPLDLNGPNAYRQRSGKISTILQDPSAALNPLMKVGKQISIVLRTIARVSAAEARAQAVELMTEVRLDSADELAQRYPHELSGGQRQRVMIAVALASNPQFVLCDEPTTALDVTVQAEILALLTKIRKTKNVGIVFVTHDLPVVSQVTDHLLVMSKGRVVESGPTRRVVTSPQHPYTQKLVENALRLQQGKVSL